MFRLVMGRAGSGKTGYVLREIRDRAEKGLKSVMLVPEQYSHDAERQLCGFCGSAISMFAEVLSFSRLADRVLAGLGRPAGHVLDSPGRVLLMSRAVAAVASQLEVLRIGSARADFLKGLLSVYDELRASGAGADALTAAAGRAEGSLAGKLRDMGLIFAAYDALIPDGACDRTQVYERLAECVADSDFWHDSAIYADGFSDFTGQERAVLEHLIRAGAEITLCLTCSGLEGEEPEFVLQRRTALRLIRTAADAQCFAGTAVLQNDARLKSKELRFLDEGLFAWPVPHYQGENGALRLRSAPSRSAECEMAAAETMRLVRAGYRYRDITVTARDWDVYASFADCVFEKYGIPTFTAEKPPILEKPPAAFLISSLTVLADGWDYQSVFRCMKTGLSGIVDADRDLLENYVLKWNIRGRTMWTRSEDWESCPSGFSKELSDSDSEELIRINMARRAFAAPLGELEAALGRAENVRGQLAALCNYAEMTALPQRIAERADALEADGDRQLADEYRRLWDIITAAVEQFAAVMGEEKLSTEEFTAHMKLLLAEYDIGTIPASLDRVAMGPMGRTRRRDVRCLIVMGASDDELPAPAPDGGLLTDAERDALRLAGTDFFDDAEDRDARETSLIYASLTLPSERLVLSFTDVGGTRESAIMTHIADMFGAVVEPVGDETRAEAERPCFELALSGRSRLSSAAREYFDAAPAWRDRLQRAERAVNFSRGRLAEHTAGKLYGPNLSVSASRVDRFYSCKFSYFLQYGLRLKARRPASLDAPSAGTFLHFVLENVARDAEKDGGIGALSENRAKALTKKYVRVYADTVLGGMRDRTKRFCHLFTRLAGNAERIVLDMVREMAASSFRPLAFELSFGRGGDLPEAHAGSGEAEISVAGKVDRVDGWLHDGRLYLRVVDYKTGRKAFSLSDIWYGLGMQMLIYLFTLQKTGSAFFGEEIVPAGVVYAPARDVIVPASPDMDDEEIERERAKKLVRSGLILNDPAVIEAMEKGETPKYLPVRFSRDHVPTGDSLASAAQLGAISAHIDRTLAEMGREVYSGDISADPYYRGPTDSACMICDFYEACHFDESRDRRRPLKKLKADEVMEKMTGGGDHHA